MLKRLMICPMWESTSIYKAIDNIKCMNKKIIHAKCDESTQNI